MGMTMTQKILAKHAGLESVRAGQLIQAKLDLVLGNDITTPVAINEFESAGFEKVFNKSRIAMVMDHFAPNKDIKSATQCKQCRTFARRFDIDHFYDVGTMGIEHALLPEQGLVAPGEAVIGADSHTCTYGALGAFSTGVGSTDMGAAMAAGETWFKVPSAIKVNLTGKLRPFVSGKDVILTLIGMIGVDGARYQSIEFSGEGVKNLTIYDRLTICNMAIEAGGKNGIFPVDDVTRAYVEGRVDRPWTAFEADPDAEYERVIDIDLGKVDCTVAWPHLPENAHSAREGSDIAIDQIVIGSCTNGQLPDMAAAAAILRALCAPSSLQCAFSRNIPNIKSKSMPSGLVRTFFAHTSPPSPANTLTSPSQFSASERTFSSSPNTANPPSLVLVKISPLARLTFSRDKNVSRCWPQMPVRIQWSGSTSLHNSSISPTCRAPISAMKYSQPSRSVPLMNFAMPSGVLYEAGVASTVCFSDSMAARMFFTLVLAKLPVIPMRTALLSASFCLAFAT